MNKINLLLKDKGFLFGIRIILAYLLWKCFMFFAHDTKWWGAFTDYIGYLYAVGCSYLLRAIGEKASAEGINVMLAKDYVAVKDLCLAFPAMFVFAASILLLQGGWINKLWYIPLGLAIMVIVNLLRISLTCYAYVHFSHFYFVIHHNFVYLIAFYSITFGLIVLWMNKFSELREDKPASL